MFTVRQIERLWEARSLRRLVADLLRGRPEDCPRIERELCRHAPAAALAMIRLDELSQGACPLYGRLLRVVLCSQEADGGWGDVPATAVCVRALLAGNGDGLAIQRGLAWLANLQKTDGAWPGIPMRRMPADALVSAFVLLMLAGEPRFREAVRLDDAIGWFERPGHVDPDAQRLWTSARFRCRTAPALPAPLPA